MARADPLLRLVDHIYEGALDPGAWPGIVAHIAEHFRAPKGFLLTNFVGPEDGGLNIATGISQRTLELWNAKYIPHDVWSPAAMAAGAFHDGGVAIESDLMPDEEFAQTKIYRELLVHEGVGRLCACIIFASGENGVLPTTMGVYRALWEPRFEPADREAMRLLGPHLSRALGVMYRLRDAELKRVASFEALDRLPVGVALLDRRGCVHHLNREARRILESGDGLDLAAPPVARAIAEVLREDLLNAPHFSSTVILPRPSGRRSYVLQFAPLPEKNNFAGAAGAIVFINDPVREIALDRAVLTSAFGITAAEARLAERLCAGSDLAAAAQHCVVAEATAKTQLAALFHKTGTHSQAQLVRLLLSLGSTAS